MTAKEYVAKFNKATDKELFFKKSITTNYVPYREKISDCNKIVKATTELDGQFKINSPAQFMLLAMTIISRYTNIEIGENIIDDFEELDKENLINMLMTFIPEREMNSYNTLLSMCNDDYIENVRSLTSFFETKFESLKLTGDILFERLQELESAN